MPWTDPAAALRAAVLVGGTAALAACAAPGSDAGRSEAGLGPAERVAAVLEGRYAGRASDAALVHLDAVIERVGTRGVEIRLDQRSDGAERAFRLVLEPTRVATRLAGRFAPLDARGEPLGACPLSVTVRSDGFVATTDAATCRFGEGAKARALVKEIAHDGRRLVIADRVVDVDRDEPVGEDRVLELQRVYAYVGWAGVRNGGDPAWRVAQSVRLSSDGRVHQPLDAAGTPLGFSLELAPHRVRDDQPPVLRLRVFDDDSGDLLAQAWGEPGAARLGVAVPGLQVGLRAANR